MKKSVVIAIFVLLGLFANSVMAAKTPKIELITLIGGPMADGATKPWACDIHNLTDRPIDTSLQVCIQNRDNSNPASCQPTVPEVTLLAARFHGFTIGSGEAASAICRVEYLGLPGEVVGTLCGSNGCVQLQPQ